jgi:ABC-type multidrug transport system permease subunit
MPSWLAWIWYLCPLTYAIRIALVNEFDGQCNDLVEANPGSRNFCNKVLNNSDSDPDETWWNWVVLAGMFVILRLLALINLRRKAEKFY